MVSLSEKNILEADYEIYLSSLAGEPNDVGTKVRLLNCPILINHEGSESS